jgi:membrane protease YdiL (CAAX protease family)
MSGWGAGIGFARLAALAEIFLALALGNIVGVAIYEAIAPAQVLSDGGGGTTEALYAGLRILLRLGSVAAIGLALLWFRRGLTPRDAGLTRAGKPLGYLVGVGLLLGGFSSFLIGMVFAVHAVVPLGEGLTGWQELRLATRDTAFYVELLATSIIIPPLVEEIMARGYMRLRLVESYGRIGGVILTGLVFALAHGKFISTDPLLAIFMIVLIVSSISWAYIAQTTGSLIPPMIAHAITNTFATVVLFDVWACFGAVTALVLWQRRPIIGTLRQFLEEWRAESDKAGLWFGALILVLIITILLIAMSQFGRMPALLGLGTLALLVAIRSFVSD